MTPFSSSSPASVSEEDMAKIKAKVLEALRSLLVDHLDPRRFITYLRTCSVLDQRECDEIKAGSERSRCEGAEKFLDVLATKGSRGYDVFCDAILRDKTQLFMLKALNKKLEFYRDHRKKQIEEDYELWKSRQWKQQILTQHKEHYRHPRPMGDHAPLNTSRTKPPHIHYPPNYRSNVSLSASHPHCRARSPVPDHEGDHGNGMENVTGGMQNGTVLVQSHAQAELYGSSAVHVPVNPADYQSNVPTQFVYPQEMIHVVPHFPPEPAPALNYHPHFSSVPPAPHAFQLPHPPEAPPHPQLVVHPATAFQQYHNNGVHHVQGNQPEFVVPQGSVFKPLNDYPCGEGGQ